MKKTQLNRKSFVNDAQFEHWFFRLAIVGLTSFLLYKLFPYDFSEINSFSFEFIINQLSQDSLSSLKDYVELLISLITSALLGFGLAGLLQNRGINPVSSLIIILLVGISLGTITELLQAILPSRSPNLSDIFEDSFGVFLGWFIFRQWRFQLFYCLSIIEQTCKRFLLRHLSLRKLTIGFVAYLLIAAAGLMILPTATDFRNWNSSFSLMLGNEQTGDRPWQGAVAQVQFFDRAMSTEEVAQLFANNLPLPVQQNTLLAAYQLTEKRNAYPDQTNHLAELAWQGTPSETLGNAGIMLSPAHWLKTSTPATYLNQRLQQQSQLTLDLIVTPASLEQFGPARIVSLSEHASQRNFTVGQEGTNLVVRLRTPVTGNNGSSPEISVPQIFTDLSSHHLVVTYANSTLQVYVDEPDNLHRFGLPHPSYKLLYYGWIFIPLGCLLGLILNITRGNLTVYIALLLSGVVLPSLLLEALLATINQRGFALENVVFSQALMLGMLFITKKQIVPWLRVQEYSK